MASSVLPNEVFFQIIQSFCEEERKRLLLTSNKFCMLVVERTKCLNRDGFSASRQFSSYRRDNLYMDYPLMKRQRTFLDGLQVNTDGSDLVVTMIHKESKEQLTFRKKVLDDGEFSKRPRSSVLARLVKTSLAICIALRYFEKSLVEKVPITRASSKPDSHVASNKFMCDDEKFSYILEIYCSKKVVKPKERHVLNGRTHEVLETKTDLPNLFAGDRVTNDYSSGFIWAFVVKISKRLRIFYAIHFVLFVIVLSNVIVLRIER
uniref:F-box domain-containing protein n=1 Tax=Ditylenchus dipsaci TaxID=166011 RepID=A0A915EK55_9BILA